MRIAILEDDNSQLEMVHSVVLGMGHDCRLFGAGDDLRASLSEETYDLLILDWNVPGVSGFEIMKWARSHLDPQPPVIFITNYSDERDIIAALSAGADDYMIKPIRASELLARLNALLRRTYPALNSRVIDFGRYQFDLRRALLRIDGVPVDLKLKEFQIAYQLFSNLGRLLSRNYLLQMIWGPDATQTSRSLDTHISRVRSLLNLRPENGFRLTAVYNQGYRLESFGSMPVTGTREW